MHSLDICFRMQLAANDPDVIPLVQFQANTGEYWLLIRIETKYQQTKSSIGHHGDTPVINPGDLAHHLESVSSGEEMAGFY